MWTPRRPEFACAANSVSLLMPSIEPYFVRVTRRALPHLDPALKDETERFVGQEAQHFSQHQVFNRLLLDRYPGLKPIDRTAQRLFRLLERRSLRFNLGFVAASETIAYSAARWAARYRRELFDGADDIPATLFLWHLAEEVEHKAAAHEVLRNYRERMIGAGNRGYSGGLFTARFVATMMLAVVIVAAFVVAGTTVTLAYERRLLHPVAWIRLTRWAVTFAFEVLTNLALSVFPGFHPEQLVDPLWYEVWLAEFDPETETVPVLSEVDPARAERA
jgi:predicted metal-dependent hydrolase